VDILKMGVLRIWHFETFWSWAF